ncbi:hypothetical protein B9Z55_024969 [Caenorhabditis nigoni]|uniref:Uncharacterized protein n=1 Tax=Caenorhabditis nigoni TaxID=1611254 RepID=A0A2G5SX28_9PELO|nr:hypothetical protein B9Z55_024969 [Caenorhabditis nigoni]
MVGGAKKDASSPRFPVTAQRKEEEEEREEVLYAVTVIHGLSFVRIVEKFEEQGEELEKGVCESSFNMKFFTATYFVFIAFALLAFAAIMVAAKVQLGCVDCKSICIQDMCVTY